MPVAMAIASNAPPGWRHSSRLITADARIRRLITSRLLLAFTETTYCNLTEATDGHVRGGNADVF
jgi:hypothetical protein